MLPDCRVQTVTYSVRPETGFVVSSKTTNLSTQTLENVNWPGQFFIFIWFENIDIVFVCRLRCLTQKLVVTVSQHLQVLQQVGVVEHSLHMGLGNRSCPFVLCFFSWCGCYLLMQKLMLLMILWMTALVMIWLMRKSRKWPTAKSIKISGLFYTM